jgi:hypothetical protein
MKKLLFGSIVLTAFSFSIVLFQMSCSKQSSAQSTTKTKDQILTEKTWRVDKLHHVIGGTYSSYTSGGANTTGINYNLLRFTFNSNGSGVHIDQNGVTKNFTWQFSTPDKRTLLLTLDATTYTWDMLEIADNYLHASVNLTIGGNSNNIETFRLIQVP